MEEDAFVGIIEKDQNHLERSEKSTVGQKGFPVDCGSGRNAKGPNRREEKDESYSVVK